MIKENQAALQIKAAEEIFKNKSIMKTQQELIKYYSENLRNVIIYHGVESDHTSYAFFLLQAVKIGVNFEDIFDWASAKLKSLEDEALESPYLN